MPKRSTLPVVKHGRNKQKHANKLKAQLKALGGVVSGRVRKVRKPGELELPVLLARDKRCRSPKVANGSTAWESVDLSPEDIADTLSRIQAKQSKGFYIAP